MRGRLKGKRTVAVAGLMSVATLAWLPHFRAQQTETVPSWSVTGGLSSIRSGYTATLLPSGKVLVAGGEDLLLPLGGSQWVTNKAQLYDPATGVWSQTGDLNWGGRVLHTATLLPNGKVLVVGGWNGADQAAPDAELYDPSTGTWTLKPGWPAFYHTATVLPCGKVLIVGGGYGGHLLGQAILYDPATDTFSATGSLQTGRAGHTATLLPNGKVLIAGGARSSDLGPFNEYPNSTEVYDPATGTWAASGNLSAGRANHTATLLPDGKVLIAGGQNEVGGSFTVLSSAEIYDPATGTCSVTGSLSRPGRTDNFHDTATLLPNGKVLFVSTGYGSELYDPTTRLWSRTADLKFGGFLETVTLLTNGKVLVTGNRFDGVTPMAELFTPSPSSTFFVPIILSSAGATGAFYSSEMTLTNRSSRDAIVEFTYNAAFGGGNGMTTDFLGAGKQQIIPDGMAARASTWLYGLQQTAETRSNLAVVNTGETDGSADVFRIAIFDGETGLKVNSLETTVSAMAWKQLGSFLAEYASGTTQAYAQVTRIAGNNPFIAYAVLNDGAQPGLRTGDGAFVAMQRELP